ncbi:MAG: endonuclease/exonuclease/phosphatase family protein [Pseudomonadota bacterium]
MPHLPPASTGFDPPPAETLATLSSLAAELDERLPPKVVDRNLLIATWNLANFARVTKRWDSRPNDNPRRNLQDLCCIAEIVSRFDVVALVEVKRNLEAFRLLLQILGPEWGFVVSDTSEGDPGHDERLGYLFDLRRVRPSGLVGEIVIPDADLGQPTSAMRKQFSRTPYSVSFHSGPKAFTLVSLHILYGDRASDRTPELRGIAKWLSEHAEDPDEFNRNFIALGDFNIDRQGDPNWNAFVVEYGLSPPDKLLFVPRTVGDTESLHSFFDQIAWFTKGPRAALTLRYLDAGTFLWTDVLLTDVPDTTKQARISDHYPLWAEFAL